MTRFVIQWLYMKNEPQNAEWQPIPLHIDVPEPPKNPPEEAAEKPAENKRNSFVINGEDDREHNPFSDPFSDPFKSDDEM